MEINQIRYFVTLSRTLNFTEAADQCGVSQPSLTRAIRVLETSVGGGDLVNRERGNVHLTELGRIMLPYFEQMLVAIEGARTTAVSFRRNEQDSLRVGLMCTIGPDVLGEFFRGFTTRNPHIRLYLKDGTASELEDVLAADDIDVAICCRPEKLAQRFHHLALYRERFVVAMAADHHLAKSEVVPFLKLHGERYLHRANCEYDEHLDSIMNGLGVAPVYPYESERDDWIQAMVGAGLGLTAIPEHAVTLSALVTRPLVDPEVFRVVQLVTVRGRKHRPALGTFVVEAKRFGWNEKTAAR